VSTSGGPAADTVANTDPIAKVKTDAVSSGKPPGFVESIKGAFTPGDDIGFGEGLKNAFFPQAGAVDTTAIGNKAFTDAFSNAKTLPRHDRHRGGSNWKNGYG
jgi:hypothetical protein